MQQSVVYLRKIQWDVEVPIGLEWEFMKAFGEAFRLNDTMEGTNFIRPVDRYYEHPNGWHVQVTVYENDEARLEQFCNEFFNSRNISFRSPYPLEQIPTPLEVFDKPAPENPETSSSAKLFTPEGRKLVAERLTSANSSASMTALMEEREPYPKAVYTTDGETILADGKPITDEESLTTLQHLNLLTMGRGF